MFVNRTYKHAWFGTVHAPSAVIVRTDPLIENLSGAIGKSRILERTREKERSKMQIFDSLRMLFTLVADRKSTRN